MLDWLSHGMMAGRGPLLGKAGDRPSFGHPALLESRFASSGEAGEAGPRRRKRFEAAPRDVDHLYLLARAAGGTGAMDDGDGAAVAF